MSNKNTDKIIAYCGFVCNDCPVFIATQEENHEVKIQLCEKYSLDLNEINCYGCTMIDNDKLFKHCKECGIRIKYFNMSNKKNRPYCLLWNCGGTNCVSVL